MIQKIGNALRKFFNNTNGSTTIEYGTVALAIPLAIILAAKATGLQVSCLYDSVAQIVGGGGGHACS